MNVQKQFDNRNDKLRERTAGVEGAEGGPGADRLAEVRADLGQAFAAADAILDSIRAGDNQRFLEQIRQSGGQ